MKIDAVITWVDGNDPNHRRKRMEYGASALATSVDKAAETRFADIGEIFWCVASLNRYASWLNKIYIVTDEQDPGLDDFLAANFPEGHIPVEVVDHKVIFRGYEDCLPTFNSISIETMTWRIPGLSDCFIEFNDDLLLLDHTTPEDFFTKDGEPICYASFASVIFDRFTRLFKARKNGTKMVTTKGTHMNGAMLAGHRFKYLRPAHCQKALRRDFYEKFFHEHEQLMHKNASQRFRDAEQFSSQVLQYMALYDVSACEIRSPKGALFFMQPDGSDGYFKKKMCRLNQFKGKFACFNSMDVAKPEQRDELVSWISGRLEVKFPSKS